jgi:hypothetical protein
MPSLFEQPFPLARFSDFSWGCALKTFVEGFALKGFGI